VGQARANKLAGLPQHQRDDGKSRIRGSGGGLHAASDLSLFLAVVTMPFVIVLMVLAPVTTFVAVIAVLIAAIGVIFVALTIIRSSTSIDIPRLLRRRDREGLFRTAVNPLRYAHPPQSLLRRSVSRSVSMPAMCFQASSFVIARVAPDLNAVAS
jgi:hypothetical protein